MKRWWIGCSGFYYKEWREAFYPKNLPQRKWFEFYCESFNTVELNVTFYRFPRVRDLKSWFDKSPDEFVFTVKAPRLITHYKKFNNVGRELHQFYDTVDSGLAYKLGPILFQLHPKIVYSQEKLQQILEAIDTSFINVVEFRDKSWWRKDVMDTLKKHNIGFCGISYPGLPDDVHSTAPFLYYRFHGVPKLYLSSYSDTELAKVVGDIKSVRGVDDVFIYFNNDIEVAAVHNAKTVQQLI
jgi:uncharacterized protein YecE (DUF72 family)